MRIKQCSLCSDFYLRVVFELKNTFRNWVYLLSGCIVRIIPRHYIELSGHLPAPASLTPGKEYAITHRTVGLVSTRAGLDDLGKSKLVAPPRVEHQILLPIPYSRSCITLWCLLQVCKSDDIELPSRWHWTCEKWPTLFQYLYRYSHRPVFPNVWSGDPKGCTTNSQGIRGCVYLTDTLKFIF